MRRAAEAIYCKHAKKALKIARARGEAAGALELEGRIWTVWTPAAGGWRYRLIRRIWPTLAMLLDDGFEAERKRLSQYAEALEERTGQ